MKYEYEELNQNTREKLSGDFVHLSAGYTHYELDGPEGGEVVVLVHGFSTPLFIWDPRCDCHSERRTALVQTIDLPATLLEYFGLELPADMQGIPLREAIAEDKPVREAALYGLHGGHVNITDGRYTYMRAPAKPENTPLYNYTLMPTHMRARFSIEELQGIRHERIRDIRPPGKSQQVADIPPRVGIVLEPVNLQDAVTQNPSILL